MDDATSPTAPAAALVRRGKRSGSCHRARRSSGRRSITRFPWFSAFGKVHLDDDRADPTDNNDASTSRHHDGTRIDDNDGDATGGAAHSPAATLPPAPVLTLPPSVPIAHPPQTEPFVPPTVSDVRSDGCAHTSGNTYVAKASFVLSGGSGWNIYEPDREPAKRALGSRTRSVFAADGSPPVVYFGSIQVDASHDPNQTKSLSLGPVAVTCH